MYKFLSLLMVVVITMTSVMFCFKMRFFHIRKTFATAKSLFSPQKGTDKSISSFTAVATVLGGNLGTGNISGMAVALTTGGAGSIFWMCVVILLTSIIKYLTCFLGVQHREIGKDGTYVGGPMVYIEHAKIKKGFKKTLSYLYATGVIVGAVTIGNFVQVNSIVMTITHTTFPPLLLGLFIAILVYGVLSGGLKRFGEIVSKIVPAMAIFYLTSCLYILFTFSDQIIPAFGHIIEDAFSPKALIGGSAGFAIYKAIEVGFARGIMATDTGLGLEGIVHASVNQGALSKNQLSVQQGLLAALSPLIVMIICVVTTLVLIVTGAYKVESLQSTQVCRHAFDIGFFNGAGSIILGITLFFFAFTTILTWAFCGKKAFLYLTKGRLSNAWVPLFVLCLPFGAILNVKSLWVFADYAVPIMLLPNLFAIILLGKKAIQITLGSSQHRNAAKKEN